MHGMLSHDAEGEGRRLLQLHADERRGHFDLDPQLVFGRADDPWLYIRSGQFQRVPREAAMDRLRQSFEGVTYHEWEDLEPPVVRVAADGSMGWIATRVGVRLTRADASGAQQEYSFVYAGIDTYEKRDGDWVRVANVSTFDEPPQLRS